jgi:hypothetical protein
MSSDLSWVLTFYVVAGFVGLLFGLAALGTLLTLIIVAMSGHSVSNRLRTLKDR